MKKSNNRTRLIKKGRQYCIVAMLLIGMLASFIAFSVPIAEASGQVTLPSIQQMFTINTHGPTPPTSTFTYRLTPRDATHPMPTGSLQNVYTFSISGDNTHSPVITFTQSGVYAYDITHTTVDRANFAHDRQTFTVTVYVASDLSATFTIHSSNNPNTKVLAMLYTNSWTAPPPTPAPPTPAPPPIPGSQGPSEPQGPTGPAGPPGRPGTTVATTPVPTPTPTPALPPETTVTPIITPPPEVDIVEPEIPFVAPEGESGWALVNLILAVAGWILGIIMAIRALRRKKDKRDEDEHNYQYQQMRQAAGTEEKEDKYQRKTRAAWLIATLIMAVAGAILFLVTEDMRLPMVMVNKWTIVNAAIFIIEAAAAMFVFKKKKDRDDDQDPPTRLI